MLPICICYPSALHDMQSITISNQLDTLNQNLPRTETNFNRSLNNIEGCFTSACSWASKRSQEPRKSQGKGPQEHGRHGSDGPLPAWHPRTAVGPRKPAV